MATIKDIAALAQVSSTTVSRVLSQDDTMVVSPEVRTKILNIARELNYVPPRMRHTQANKKMIIGIADWQIVRKDRPNVRISSLNKIAATISSSVESEFERMQKDLYKIYDGVIAFGIFSDEEMEQLKAQSRAIVFINSDEKDYRYDSIVMDFDRGMRDAIDYLMNKRQYRTIGYIGGVYEEGNVRIGYRRLKGVRELFLQYECLNENNIFVGELSRESGYSLAKKAIASGHLPEALLLGSDEITEGAIEAIQEEKLRVPKDVAVVIYEDIKTLESKWTDYTRVCMFPDIVWETAVKLLIEQVRDCRTDNMTIFLPGKFEQGESA